MTREQPRAGHEAWMPRLRLFSRVSRGAACCAPTILLSLPEASEHVILSPAGAKELLSPSCEGPVAACHRSAAPVFSSPSPNGDALCVQATPSPFSSPPHSAARPPPRRTRAPKPSRPSTLPTPTGLDSPPPVTLTGSRTCTTRTA